MMLHLRRTGVFLGIGLLLAFGISTPAQAVAVVKVTADIKNGLTENIPLSTEEGWQFQATVGNHTTSEPLTKVEWRDGYTSEVTVDGVVFIDCGTVTIGPGKEPGTTEMRWVIGDMAVGQTCTLRYDVSTANGPPQQFTTAGEHCLNNGASLRFRNALLEQESRVGPTLCVTTI